MLHPDNITAQSNIHTILQFHPSSIQSHLFFGAYAQHQIFLLFFQTKTTSTVEYRSCKSNETTQLDIMPRFALSPNSFRKKSTPQDHLQSSQQQYPNAADVMDNRQQHVSSSTSIYEALATAELAAEAEGRAITTKILPASDNDATMHSQEHQQEQSPPPLSSSLSSAASAKFASVIRRRRRQQQEPSSSSQQQQQHQQQQSAKSLVSVLLTSTIQNKRNKSHIFKGKHEDDRQKEQQHQQELDRQLQVNEKVLQFYRAPLPDQWTTTTAGSHPTQVNNNGDSNNNNNSNMVKSWLQQNRNDSQQHQQKESKREIATTTATTSTMTTTMRDNDEVGIVEAMSSPHEGQPWHQELSALSPIMQQQKEWYQHEGKKGEQSTDGSAACVSEGVWTNIKKRSGLSSSLSLPSFFPFKHGDHGLRQRQGLPPPTPTGAPSQMINTHADNDGRALVSLADAAKATATAARDRGVSTTATRSRRKNKGFLLFSSVRPATAGAAKRRRSHGNLIVDSPLSSPIATMSTTHSATVAAISPRSHSLASIPSSPPFLSNNIINDNDFSFFYPSSSPPSSSPNDDTDDVEAQRSRLIAIRYSWHEQFQSPGDPVLIPSSTLPKHKKVQRSNTAAAVTTSINNNTNNTTCTSTTSGTTPTDSFRLGASSYNQNRNNKASSAFLDQETTRTWRGLFVSVRQLSHDTSTTGSSTHSASTTSLSSSAQSFNEKDQRQSRKTKHDCHQSQHRENRRYSKHRNPDGASTIRAIGPFFARRRSSSSQHKVITTATASLTTIDLEKRAMMTKSPPRKLTILVVGDGAVGKSALTLRFLRDQYVITSSRGKGERRRPSSSSSSPLIILLIDPLVFR